MLDTTIRPLCFGIPYDVSPEVAKSVGPEKFKRYEYVLYTMAQLSRIVYCDTGIMHKVIQSSLGLSNDVVNKVITAYDWKYVKERRTAITSQPSRLVNIPMESYSLGPPGSGTKYGTYISTADDMTCLLINAASMKANSNSIYLPSDVIVSFKGSSTMDNFKHDIMSQFTGADLGGLIQSTGVKVAGQGNIVTGSFVNPLVKAWSTLVNGLTSHITNDNTRLFLTGHSLGGAYASLFAFILAEAKVSNTLPVMNKVKSIHLISFGAPCILGDTARNTFNRHLDSGLITLDRVVSQKVPARSAGTQVLVGGIAGPNDVIPTIPAGFSHPGYRPLANPLKNAYPESKGRPYSMDFVRKFYGVPAKTRYREPTSWPFNEGMELGDRKNAADLKRIVSQITQLQEVPEEGDPVAPEVQVKTGDPSELQAGGGKEKDIYSANTLKRIPNFVSVAGSVYAFGFAHAEYLGMFFTGGFRLAGMKNPTPPGGPDAYFELYPNGLKIDYTTKSASTILPNENPTQPNIVSGGGKTRRNKQKRNKRKTRRT